MRKIFYHPETLEIKGMSDGQESMNFPHVKTKVDYHSTQNMEIRTTKSGKHKLHLTKK